MDIRTPQDTIKGVTYHDRRRAHELPMLPFLAIAAISFIAGFVFALGDVV